MKKLTKLSLVASLALSCSLSADSLAEAFSKTKVNGELKAQYFNVQPALNKSTNPASPSDGSNDTITVLGGNLNATTGSFYGAKLVSTFQASSVQSINTKQNNDFAGTMDASGSVLSQFHVDYQIGKTNVKVGRQYITTPLVAGSGSRMIKQSFEAYVLANTDLPNTTLVAAYVSKFQGRTDGAGAPGKFNSYKDGAWTLYAKNTSVKNLTLQAQYLNENGKTSASDMKAQYVDATYKAGPVTVAAQYMGSKPGNGDKASLMGLKASGNVAMVNLTGLYTTTGNKGTVDPGAGSGADGSFTALPLHGGGVTYVAKTDTAVAVAATKVAGATVVAYYGIVNTDKSVKAGYEEIKAYGGFVQYAFNKQASVKVMYESADFDTLKHDDNIFRVYTSYKF